MIKFKALVRDKQSGKLTTIESEYPNKTAFIQDLRGNGYAVNPKKVKTSEGFDHVVNYTNMEEWDWDKVK